MSMGKQSDAFIASEGQFWSTRNNYQLSKLNPEDDPIARMIEDADLKPERIFEIGCGNGWRLEHLKKKYGCLTNGIDPYLAPGSRAGIERGIASDLRFYEDGEFDLVIYGFCLYLCDREDLFRIVMEGDRVLEDGGHIIIHDFMPLRPHSRPYKHQPGLMSYKMNYANLWLGNPAYTSTRVLAKVATSDDEAEMTVMLKKDMKGAWPCKSF